MGTAYETDVAAWSIEQALLLRAGQFSAIDVEHLAEEIEDVGKSEKRELASRMAVLLAHLLKWQYQPERRGASWERTIKTQRKALTYHLKQVPSLKPKLSDPEWNEFVWADALTIAIQETGMNDFPEANPWSFHEVLSESWLPTNE